MAEIYQRLPEEEGYAGPRPSIEGIMWRHECYAHHTSAILQRIINIISKMRYMRRTMVEAVQLWVPGSEKSLVYRMLDWFRAWVDIAELLVIVGSSKGVFFKLA